ncbi:hypothetical protein MSIBF_A1960009 [groundwater metagenome]|uniref:DUF460 domain-containing protein n=2 Tax=groundwater metagenome TaxID=717931 RepID=A0A098EAT4_9ZZZZ
MYLIVGFDPGTSVGIGIINFNCEVIDLFSAKNMGINEVVAHIIKFGTVAIVASDVDHIPYSLYKVATALNAKIFIPENSISVSEKVFLTRNVKYHDAHQRDSLSAALYAYKRYKNLFEKIKNLGYGDDVRALVIKGKSLAEAIAETSAEPVEAAKFLQEQDVSEASFEISKEKFNDIKEHLRILEKANKILKAEIKTKDAEIENLNYAVKSLERDIKFKSEKAIREEEKFEKRAMEISLKGIIEQIKNAEGVIKALENFYERIGKGEIYLVGNYPEIFNGLTYIDKNIVVNTADINKIEIAWTEKKIRNCKTISPQKLKKFSNIYYIENKDLNEIRTSGNVESIVEEYRKERRR